MIYSPGTAPRARFQVNILHTPEGQVNIMLIFHFYGFLKQKAFEKALIL